MNQLLESIKEDLWESIGALYCDLYPFTEGLEERFGIDTHSYYSYSPEDEEFFEISFNDADEYNRIVATFDRPCRCAHHSSYTSSMNLEMKFFQVAYHNAFDRETKDVPEDDKAVLVGANQSDVDDIVPSDISKISDCDALLVKGTVRDKLCSTMLRVHGLVHLKSEPRRGCHFIQGWASPFSKDWYAASFICSLLKLNDEIGRLEAGSIAKVVNGVYHLGHSVSELHWREKHFKNASAGLVQSNSLIAATKSMVKRSKNRSRGKLECIKILWNLVCIENVECKRFDEVAAQAIHDHLLRHAGEARYRFLIVKTTATPIGQDAIRRHLRTLRKVGEI
jgi:hypothetical protein